MIINTTVTTSDIESLRAEAAADGDDDQVELCDAALAGDADARTECEQVIIAARAMDDGDDE